MSEQTIHWARWETSWRIRYPGELEAAAVEFLTAGLAEDVGVRGVLAAGPGRAGWQVSAVPVLERRQQRLVVGVEVPFSVHYLHLLLLWLLLEMKRHLWQYRSMAEIGSLRVLLLDKLWWPRHLSCSECNLVFLNAYADLLHLDVVSVLHRRLVLDPGCWVGLVLGVLLALLLGFVGALSPLLLGFR